MRDNELMLRGLAFALRSAAYGGNLKKFLDESFDSFNDGWASKAAQVSAAADEFESAVLSTMTIFEDKAFSRYRPGRGYDRRFNRAIFDVFAYLLRAAKVRESAEKNSAKIMKAFEELCSTDQEFIDSITSTTKSPRNTSYRYSAGARMLTSATGLSIDPPPGLDLRLS